MANCHIIAKLPLSIIKDSKNTTIAGSESPQMLREAGIVIRPPPFNETSADSLPCFAKTF